MTIALALEELARRMDLALAFGLSTTEALYMAIKAQSDKGKKTLRLDICELGLALTAYLLRRTDKNKEESFFYVEKNMKLYKEKA